MPLGPYLIRRGNALVFRRRVPKGHAELFSSPFLSLPLRTHLLPEGRLRALRLAAFADAAFALLEDRREAGTLDGTTEERVILELMRFELDVTEHVRALAPARGPAEVQAALALTAATARRCALPSSTTTTPPSRRRSPPPAFGFGSSSARPPTGGASPAAPPRR